MTIIDNHEFSETYLSKNDRFFDYRDYYPVVLRRPWFAEPTDQHKVKNDFHFQAFTPDISKF
jgi:hypothetical protein